MVNNGLLTDVRDFSGLFGILRGREVESSERRREVREEGEPGEACLLRELLQID